MSTTGDKAKRATVVIGSLSAYSFQMPEGSYRMSQAQVAERVGKHEINARRFLDLKGSKALRGKGYMPDTIEVDSSEQGRGQTRFNALPLDAISAYWLWEASKGNQRAITLCYALMTETLERRFETTFGVERSESEREARLEQQLRDAGIEPWDISGKKSD